MSLSKDDAAALREAMLKFEEGLQWIRMVVDSSTLPALAGESAPAEPAKPAEAKAPKKRRHFRSPVSDDAISTPAMKVKFGEVVHQAHPMLAEYLCVTQGYLGQRRREGDGPPRNEKYGSKTNNFIDVEVLAVWLQNERAEGRF